MPSTGWSPISRTDSTQTGARGRGSPTRTLSIRALGSPVAATYGLGRSQVQPGDMGSAYRQASTRTRPGTIGAVLCDPGRWLLWRARGGSSGWLTGRLPGGGAPLLSEGITSPVGAQAI